ncbi:glycoside hydrolase family 57 protein [Thermophagus xiamenensis]|uniref:Alpha-amylase n=1 Tax=Thermophagus xiamenensis TaxID=385682 RepID=A0A1I1Y5A5_9BACT|nr:glycoside hydrolase family 57 protein [Thermophagus xiamenensis]SFE14178.1 alpha-amylase [Thermophagus xiamenensis]
MKTVCLYFQVHQPFRFRRYRFFDIGNDHYYFDDYTNESILNKIATNCYLPTNELLLRLIEKFKGKFKVSFSITGVAIEQFKLYAPEVLESFKKLADTGCVEFLGETYAHSLVALKDEAAFRQQVMSHSDLMEELFGKRPVVFRNTELIYSDQIGEMVARMGFKAMLTEGAKHVLGWKSPNFLYCNVLNPRLKVLLKNFKLSDDIAFRFGNKEWSEWPLTGSKFAGWIRQLDRKEEVVNLFLDYETFGEHQRKETGIFEFLEYLPAEILRYRSLKFGTPSEIAAELQVVAPVKVPNPVSWADEERDLTAWLGNEMQQEAFDKLYDLLPKMSRCTDSKLLQDWNYLQCSDHLYYMCTKFFSDGDVHAYFNPYETPYEAFINYMNVLSDFSLRLNAAVPSNSEQKELAGLTTILEEKDSKIKKLEEELNLIRSRKRKSKVKKDGVKKRKTTAKDVSASTSEKPESKAKKEVKPKKVNKVT